MNARQGAGGDPLRDEAVYYQYYGPIEGGHFARKSRGPRVV